MQLRVGKLQEELLNFLINLKMKRMFTVEACKIKSINYFKCGPNPVPAAIKDNMKSQQTGNLQSGGVKWRLHY